MNLADCLLWSYVTKSWGGAPTKFPDRPTRYNLFWTILDRFAFGGEVLYRMSFKAAWMLDFEGDLTVFKTQCFGNDGRTEIMDERATGVYSLALCYLFGADFENLINSMLLLLSSHILNILYCEI